MPRAQLPTLVQAQAIAPVYIKEILSPKSTQAESVSVAPSKEDAVHRQKDRHCSMQTPRRVIPCIQCRIVQGIGSSAPVMLAEVWVRPAYVRTENELGLENLEFVQFRIQALGVRFTAELCSMNKLSWPEEPGQCCGADPSLQDSAAVFTSSNGNHGLGCDATRPDPITRPEAAPGAQLPICGAQQLEGIGEIALLINL
ncbi:hypothetical protein A6R68_18820, partial [Neotoma lepida]